MKDDTRPELSQLFYLKLSSPTAGASLASDPNSTLSVVRVAASDHPHGIFKIEGRQQYALDEGDNQTLVIKREGGMLGIVEVNYEIVGNADEDVSLYHTGGW